MLQDLLRSREYDRLLKSDTFMGMVESMQTGTRVSQAKLEHMRNMYVRESAQLAQLGNQRAYDLYASILHRFMDQQLNDPSLTDERLAIQQDSQQRFLNALRDNLDAQSAAALVEVQKARWAAENPFAGAFGNPMQFQTPLGKVPLMDRETGDVNFVPVVQNVEHHRIDSDSDRSISPSGVTGTGAPIFDVAAELEHRGRSRERMEHLLHEMARNITADGVRGMEMPTRQETYVPTDSAKASSSSGLSRAIPFEVTRPLPTPGGEKHMAETYRNLRTLAEEGGAASAAASSSAELPKQKRSQSRPRFVQ
jgi:hypothetical protein